MPSTASCDANYGATEGCSCEGRRIDYSTATIKVPANPDDHTRKAAKHVACYMDAVEPIVKGIKDSSSDASLNLLYYGSESGIFWNYPGFLWERDDADSLQCSASYDPRLRPWYVSGASGPKNVVLILDTSGSMGQYGRLDSMKEAAKRVVGGLTHADSVAVVRFSTDASSENSYLVPATASYRFKINAWIDDIMATGSTNYVDALSEAINIVRRSEGAGLTTGCKTAYVFLSDGEPSNDESEIVAKLQSLNSQTEAVFWYGLGTAGTRAESILSNLACESSSIYTPVPDYDTSGLTSLLSSYYHFFSVERSEAAEVGYVPRVSWSEPYTAIPDIWGPVTTAVVPVYDKSSSPWVLAGVAAIDVPVCELVGAVEAAGYTGDAGDNVGPTTTKQGCECLDGFEYDGRRFDNGECTDYDWATPWCAVPAGCGICDGSVTDLSSGTTVCWDECSTAGSAEGLVEAMLKEQSLDDACPPGTMSDCDLLALRMQSWDEYDLYRCMQQSCTYPADLRVNNVFEGTSISSSDYESRGFESTTSRSDICADISQSIANCASCEGLLMSPTCSAEQCVMAAVRRSEIGFVDPVEEACGRAEAAPSRDDDSDDSGRGGGGDSDGSGEPEPFDTSVVGYAIAPLLILGFGLVAYRTHRRKMMARQNAQASFQSEMRPPMVVGSGVQPGYGPPPVVINAAAPPPGYGAPGYAQPPPAQATYAQPQPVQYAPQQPAFVTAPAAPPQYQYQ